jgi:hypothetical protein
MKTLSKSSISARGLLSGLTPGGDYSSYAHKKNLTTSPGVFIRRRIKFTAHREQRRVQELLRSEIASGQLSIGSAIVLALAQKCITQEGPQNRELRVAEPLFRDMEEVKNATALFAGTDIPPNPANEPDQIACS